MSCTAEVSGGIWSALDQIKLVLPPVYLLIGTPLNLLTLVIMTKNASNKRTHGGTDRSQRTLLYFRILAVMDLATLYTRMLPLWISTLRQTNISDTNPVTCSLFNNFCSNTVGDISVWLVVAITADRYISLRFPVKSRTHLTNKKPYLVLAVLVVAFITKNSPYLWVYRLMPDSEKANITTLFCLPSQDQPGYHFMVFGSRRALALITIGVIPALTVLILNILIFTRWRHLQVARQCPAISNSNQVVPAEQVVTVTSNSSNDKDVAVVLAVATLFLIYLIPFFSFLATLKLWPSDKCHDALKILLLYCLEFIFYLNFTTNFVLYVLFSKSFRERLIHLLPRKLTRSLMRTESTENTN